MIGRLARIDARRPASWIAAVAAAVSVSMLEGRGASAWVACACGVLLALAATGDVAHLASLPGIAARRVVARGAWPAVGVAVGVVIVRCLGADSPRTTSTALPVSIGLLGGLAAVAVWASRAGRRWSGAEAVVFDTGVAGDSGHRGWLDGPAMASMLVAMAVCYFLAPHLAGWYAMVAATWFVVLVVPRATMPGGDAAARLALVASAVGRPRPPGVPGQVVRALAAGAAILGWPAVVAASLWAGPPWSADGPLAALALLAALAGVAAVAACCLRLPGDTPFAAAVAVFVGVASGFAQSP